MITWSLRRASDTSRVVAGRSRRGRGRLVRQASPSGGMRSPRRPSGVAWTSRSTTRTPAGTPTVPSSAPNRAGSIATARAGWRASMRHGGPSSAEHPPSDHTRALQRPRSATADPLRFPRGASRRASGGDVGVVTGPIDNPAHGDGAQRLRPGWCVHRRAATAPLSGVVTAKRPPGRVPWRRRGRRIRSGT